MIRIMPVEFGRDARPRRDTRLQSLGPSDTGFWCRQSCQTGEPSAKTVERCVSNRVERGVGPGEVTRICYFRSFDQTSRRFESTRALRRAQRSATIGDRQRNKKVAAQND